MLEDNQAPFFPPSAFTSALVFIFLFLQIFDLPVKFITARAISGPTGVSLQHHPPHSWL